MSIGRDIPPQAPHTMGGGWRGGMAGNSSMNPLMQYISSFGGGDLGGLSEMAQQYLLEYLRNRGGNPMPAPPMNRQGQPPMDYPGFEPKAMRPDVPFGFNPPQYPAPSRQGGQGNEVRPQGWNRNGYS